MSFFSFFNSAPSISVVDASKKVREKNTAFIDVRTPAEFKSGHAQGAQNCPLSSLDEYVDSLKKFPEVYVICQSGGRSTTATAQLRAKGINAINISGGTLAWRSKNLPIS